LGTFIKVALKARQIGICVALLAVQLAVHAMAAEPFALIADVEGKVLINQGNGFLVAKKAMPVEPGNRIFIGAKSEVSLTYNSMGCTAVLSKAAIVKITKTVECAPELVLNTMDAVVAAPLAPAAAASGGASTIPTVAVFGGVNAFPAIAWGATEYFSPIPDMVPVSLP
jgi:hypothetical protein